jgi:hypothetical protein
MAADEEIQQVWGLAGPFLAKDTRGAQFPATEWRSLATLIAAIPNSCTAEFLEPGDYFEDAGCLVIAYRAQNSAVVGIPIDRISERDPPTFVSENARKMKWTADFQSVSDWFCVDVLWNLVNQGRGVCGHAGKGGRAARKRLFPTCKHLVPQASRVGLEFLSFSETALICLAGKEVYAWAQSEEAWEAATEHGKINWSYCTLDDEV